MATWKNPHGGRVWSRERRGYCKVLIQKCIAIGLEPPTARFEVQLLGEELLGPPETNMWNGRPDLVSPPLWELLP